MDAVQSITLVGAQFKNRLPQRYFKHRVLLVEDSPESEDLVRRICETVDGNMRLKCVRTAEEAEKILEINPNYDLIIADHFLAGQTTGLDLWKTCQERFKQIPFMMTSSLTPKEFFNITDPIVDPDLEYPHFLPKPFHKEDCQKMIEWHLEVLPEIKSSVEIQGSLNLNKVPESSYRETYGVITAIVIFLTFLLTPAQIQTVKDLFSDNSKQKKVNNIQLPKINTNSNERTLILPAPPKTHMEIRDIFTPDILQRMARIEKRADEINQILNFNPVAQDKKRPERSILAGEKLNIGDNLSLQKTNYKIDTE